MSDSELVVQDWEIWYSYSTYLHGGIGDLTDVAQRLVASSLAECAILRDGRTYWRGADGLETADLAFKKTRRTVPRATMTFPAEVEGQAFDAMRQAAEFMVNERFLFGVEASPFPEHVRAFLGPILLRSRHGDGVFVHLFVCLLFRFAIRGCGSSGGAWDRPEISDG